MGIIDNPFDMSDEDFRAESKSQRGQSNAFAIANSVGISADNEEARLWIVDTYNRGSDLKELTYIDEGISEVADGSVPIYYDHLWMVFVGVAGWQGENQDYLDEMGWWGSDNDLNKAAQIILYGIAERILYQYVEDNNLGD